jgi:hypothetical protein
MSTRPPPPLRGDAALVVLAAAAERARLVLGVDSASISEWEREHGCLRTRVNAGVLGPGEERRPTDEVYPVHTFPALVTLLEKRTPYCFGHGDPVDVSSASLAASLGKDTHAAAPISLRGQVWGSLWVASVPGGRPLARGDIPRIVRAANGIARVLDDAAAAGQPPR